MTRYGEFAALAVLLLAIDGLSQPAPNTPPTEAAPLRIIYTGKFLGYLRVPSLQPIIVDKKLIGRCPDISSYDSPAAIKLLSKYDTSKSDSDSTWIESFSNSIRLGTGDNFAPQLEARVFARGGGSGTYVPGNKELYDWTGERWVQVKNLSEPEQQLLSTYKALGSSTIPTDNVACLLSAANYTAVVPGKHDFYFGAERVRQLARFMASIDQANYQPVQMLGANLVIKTARTEPPPSVSPKPRSKWPDESSVKNLGDGKSIYPWFSSVVSVRVPAPTSPQIQEDLQKWFAEHKQTGLSEVEKFLDGRVKTSSGEQTTDWRTFRATLGHLDSIYVCPANEFNEVPAGCKQGWKARETSVTGDESGITYSMTILRDNPMPIGDQHYYSFEPGRNYGLCQRDEAATSPRAEEIETHCMPFVVHRPFFNFPRPLPVSGTKYKDPDPFVVLRNKDTPNRDVAIFGVVDPIISEEVGILNFSWLDEDTKLKTVVSAEDPAEALKEQLKYFDAWYEKKGRGKFSGLKVLLAQMSPQRARVLAAHFRDFQVVITAADEDQGTSDTTMQTIWKKEVPAGVFVAVPLPYVDSKVQDDKREGTVHLGMIEASPWDDARSWDIRGSNLAKLPVNQIEDKAECFTDAVVEALNKCLPDDFPRKSDKPSDSIKWLTLCVMREQVHADVALIQKRDFFSGPNQSTEIPNDFQQVLDRIIWKGDLLALMYVPGSALKKALDLSKKYNLEDTNNLSLANEKLRGLETLGIKKTDKELLINEVPLDDKKIYAVATTDYIGAGDTGYPDLAAAALDPKTRAAQFPNLLEPISALVCRKLYPGDPDGHCLNDIQRDKYLDPIAVGPPPSPRRPGFGSRLGNLFPFKLAAKIENPKTTAEALDQKVQQRPIWMLSLRNLSLSFNGLNNNLTDAEITRNFGAVKTSGVTAKYAQTIATGLDLRVTRSSHTGGPFVATTIDYKRQTTGDVSPKISQINNRVTGEAGYIRNLRGGRSEKSMGMSLSLYSETQLQKPFTTFNLGTGDPLKIPQSRSLMLLPRAGLFWRNGTMNFFTGGMQVGQELRALLGYKFVTPSGTFVCLPKVNETFADCIKTLSTGSAPSITINSAASAILGNRPRSGFYWKSAFTIPFSPKMKYEFSDSGDFFFKFSQDNATDTRYRDESKHSLKFVIWPSLSIGPTLRLLLYKNKVNNDFLFQKEFGFETTFAFDLFNRREKGVQLKRKP